MTGRGAMCQGLALQQRRNVAFFGPGAAPHIPCENLRTFEPADPAGSLGKEIYGDLARARRASGRHHRRG